MAGATVATAAKPTSEWGELWQVFRVYWSLLLGNVVEWYEFTIYGYQAIYLEKNFFHGSAVGVWLGFSVTFLARPLGGLFLGTIGDRFGRSVAVNISIVGMLIGTCGQGCLPTANCGIPWLANLGLVLLVITRFLQGLSAGGEIATITTYLTEVASPKILSRGVALVNVTAAAGFLAAKFIAYLMEVWFGAEGVEAWAWRIPFILTIIPGGIAIVGRRYIPESAMFLEGQEESLKVDGQRETACQKLKTLFVGYWPNMLVAFGVVATHGVMTYGCGVWIQSFLAKSGMTPGDRMVVDLVARFFNFALAMPVGWLADKYGLGFMIFVSFCLMILAFLPLWVAVHSGPSQLVTGVLAFGCGYSIFATVLGSLIYHFAVENFPVSVRNAGMGIAYNLGMSICGGLSPLVVMLSLRKTWLGPGIVYTVAACFGFCTVLIGRCLTKNNVLKMANVRPIPYWGPLGGDEKYMSKDLSGNFDFEDSIKTVPCKV
mmetsp:Transcript_1421/g.3153  ORF Transcript_1421/g.3153 Transcript_1421/m.3153 type:complete len:487 (-) Transcript_1421:291-1751(-)|eukprot:CAMPEP_0206449666 /NCGR_PEP_ID=MMETSP0324_2-20121206/18234_1 /ASSEMBLY_ACC=CAM_ASM_000836 /TAXON_ID=2866 /ORGANISM="Crypthecodinium cohnii, Strain Seligo" /LENGTH=486 /DNA_ID=CAMNT_0053919105 /DNA_START=86 /DNA_END=1546 /DNA_ORIENTATION=-